MHAEDVGHIQEEAISMSMEAVTEYTGQLLQVMLNKAEKRGGVATLGRQYEKQNAALH